MQDFRRALIRMLIVAFNVYIVIAVEALAVFSIFTIHEISNVAGSPPGLPVRA